MGNTIKTKNEHEKYIILRDKIKIYEVAKIRCRDKLMKLESIPTKDEIEFVRQFEIKNKANISKAGKNLSEYDKKVRNVFLNPDKKPVKVDFNTLKSIFLNIYRHKYHEYVLNADTSENLHSLLYYFSIDKRFLTSPRLVTELNFNGKIKKLKPTSRKGLMIIGSYGVSKSSSMEVMREIYYRLSKNGYNTSNTLFRSYSANKVVEIYESCKSTEEKARFNKDMGKGVVHFGDLKTEREASNYGKANLMKDIIEKRYEDGIKTHVDLNFRKGHEGNVEEALLELGEKYGSRFFDRIFEMFNIIVFEGKSFRGLF